MRVVEHRDQRVVVALDAGGVRAVLERLEKGVGQPGMALHPAHRLGVAQVEVQPDEGRGLCLLGRVGGRVAFQCLGIGKQLQPLRGLHRVDGLCRAAGGVHAVAADQACRISPVVLAGSAGGRCVHGQGRRNNKGMVGNAAVTT